MKGKRWFGLAALACVACCSIPFLLVGAGGLAAISADAWICGSLLLVGAAIWFLIARKRQAQTACATTGASSCSTDCGCKPN